MPGKRPCHVQAIASASSAFCLAPGVSPTQPNMSSRAETRALLLPSRSANRASRPSTGRWRASQSRDLHLLSALRRRLNFEVTYPSGTILTEAPSIVETTHTKQQKGGCEGPHPPAPNPALPMLRAFKELSSRPQRRDLSCSTPLFSPPAPESVIPTAAEGSLLAGAFLLAFVSFALPPLAVIPSAVEGSAFALQSEISSDSARSLCHPERSGGISLLF